VDVTILEINKCWTMFSAVWENYVLEKRFVSVMIKEPIKGTLYIHELSRLQFSCCFAHYSCVVCATLFLTSRSG
jgi:hypothetical protein